MDQLRRLGMQDRWIYEVLISTFRDGTPHAAPIGVWTSGTDKLYMDVYNGSQTLANILDSGNFVANFPADAGMLYAALRAPAQLRVRGGANRPCARRRRMHGQRRARPEQRDSQRRQGAPRGRRQARAPQRDASLDQPRRRTPAREPGPHHETGAQKRRCCADDAHRELPGRAQSGAGICLRTCAGCAPPGARPDLIARPSALPLSLPCCGHGSRRPALLCQRPPGIP